MLRFTKAASVPEVLTMRLSKVNTWGIKNLNLTSEQIRAARMLLRWEQRDLAEASGISLPSIKRLETQPGELSAQERTLRELRRALEKAGIEFIAEDGVRLKRKRKT